MRLRRYQCSSQQAHPVVVVVLLRVILKSPAMHRRGVHVYQRRGDGCRLRNQRYGNLFHLRAQLSQLADGPRDGVAHLGLHAIGTHAVAEHAHPQSAYARVEAIQIVGDRGVACVTVVGVISRDGAQRCGAVSDGARDGPGGVHRPSGGQHTVAADQAPGGPDSHQPAEGGGAAYGAGSVLTQRRSAQEGGRSRAGAAAGGAGVARQIPRVAGTAVGVMKGVAHGELAHVELAQQHRPGILQLGHHRGVVVRHVVAQDGRPAGGKDAVGAELVLDCYGHAVERAAIVARADFGLGLPRLCHRLLGGDCDV